MKSITKKSVAGLLAVALLLGTIFATMPFFNVQAEDTVNRPVMYPAITSSNTINTKVVFLDIPSSITTEEEIINYLTSIGILKELSEYQKI
nr:hypothetical protein [Lachnospiraceae bacterium]